LYKKDKSITQSLPIDFLTFVRYFAWKQLNHRLTGLDNEYEPIGYDVCYQLMNNMGLIMFDLDTKGNAYDLS